MLHEWLHLALTPRIGPATIKKLLGHFGSVTNILQQNSAVLEKFLPSKVARLLLDCSAAPLIKKSFDWLKQSENHHIICLADKCYPKELANISDPPAILYLHGDINLLAQQKFAIVGTRHPTTQGKENAVKFAYELAKSNLTIVSGVAAGIDRFAHVGALKGKGSTIGVIGTGINICYPKINQDMHTQIINQGLLVSEFPIGTPPMVNNFPRRNRIVAGLSLGCLVIESAVDGGSMISANFALEMGREVMAIPGSIHNPVARGCHKLIKNGAKLVENINDIFEELNLPTTIFTLGVEPVNPILDVMGFDPINIDTICNNLNTSFSDICAKLLDLELSGQVINCGSGQYQRIMR